MLGGPGARTFRETSSSVLTAPFRLLSPARPPVEPFWALRDVDFDIAAGEAVGIIGRNGAGKSTLLKILSRITAPTKGEVRLRGKVASLLEVGTGFHGELSGRENIFLNGAIMGMAQREVRARFDEIVAFAEVERFLDTPVKRYSSGMYVRLAFAVAAHLQPEILVVDEVLAVGDASFQRKCLGKMQIGRLAAAAPSSSSATTWRRSPGCASGRSCSATARSRRTALSPRSRRSTRAERTARARPKSTSACGAARFLVRSMSVCSPRA